MAQLHNRTIINVPLILAWQRLGALGMGTYACGVLSRSGRFQDGQQHRIGGDEFGILLTGQSVALALLVAEQVQRCLSGYRFVWQDQNFAVGVSTGMVALDTSTESATNVPCAKLCFEITETAAISNLHTAQHFISSLRARGCKIALDDFGSGLSSFAYLRNLPVDVLKIDGQFVRDIAHDPISLAMVKSIHEIGCLMGKRAVAEFVESPAILAVLCDIGVHYAQGYAVGYPVPLDQVLA